MLFVIQKTEDVVSPWSSKMRVLKSSSILSFITAAVSGQVSKPDLLAPLDQRVASWFLDTGYCQRACDGHSGRASLGSLSERLGMGRAGS